MEWTHFEELSTYNCTYNELANTLLLGHCPAHLTNTQVNLDRIRNAKPNNAYVMESFDVCIPIPALYTNVSIDSAL
ncbi:hypothetical protein KIN20_026870 [Parelaphostrongylus tenuis]|uniref:Uncharacterized protein n=1 Tax=Parelaphostrongylus tenuis TaxID=148309 RepID=A0AAD5QYM5_PARTN|nr:hypothetical protein KIN20_026870 [Parelaphostrongylus tenuis]